MSIILKSPNANSYFVHKPVVVDYVWTQQSVQSIFTPDLQKATKFSTIQEAKRAYSDTIAALKEQLLGPAHLAHWVKAGGYPMTGSYGSSMSLSALCFSQYCKELSEKVKTGVVKNLGTYAEQIRKKDLQDLYSWATANLPLSTYQKDSLDCSFDDAYGGYPSNHMMGPSRSSHGPIAMLAHEIICAIEPKVIPTQELLTQLSKFYLSILPKPTDLVPTTMDPVPGVLTDLKKEYAVRIPSGPGMAFLGDKENNTPVYELGSAVRFANIKTAQTRAKKLSGYVVEIRPQIIAVYAPVEVKEGPGKKECDAFGALIEKNSLDLLVANHLAKSVGNLAKKKSQKTGNDLVPLDEKNIAATPTAVKKKATPKSSVKLGHRL